MQKEILPYLPKDVYSLKFIRSARLSPDGARLVYALSVVDREKEEEHFSLWLLEIASGSARRLTAGTKKDYNPEWSPDGKQIAFVSTRNGSPQIYVIAADGGEARQLSEVKQGVGGGPLWSPDGSTLAFTAGPEIDPPDFKKPYRVDRNIYRFDAIGYLHPVMQSIFVLPAEGGEARKLVDNGMMNTLQTWSPDSQRILFLSAFAPDSHDIDTVLKVVSLDGQVEDVTGADWFAAAAEWLPDGQRVAFIGSRREDPIGTKLDLWVKEISGEVVCRTATLPMGVAGGLQGDMPLSLIRTPRVLIGKDGLYSIVQVQDGGEIHIYQVDLTGEENLRLLLKGERTAVPVDYKAGAIVFFGSDVNLPGDLFWLDPITCEERRLTEVNQAELAGRAHTTVEHLRYPSKDGEMVEGWLMKPSTGQAPYPTVLYIHGGPHSGFGHIFSFDFHMLADAGYAVLFINQRGSKGYDNAFATQILGDWGNLDYADLMYGVDYAIARGLVDGERMGCCGLSGGGNLSCWIIGHTDRFKAAVPENPVTNWVSFYGVSDIGPVFAVKELGGLPHEKPDVYSRCSPITYAHLCKTPTLFVQGEADYRCPAEQSEQFYSVLKANGCVTEMVRLPGSPHGGSMDGDPAVRLAQNEALLGWMQKYV